MPKITVSLDIYGQQRPRSAGASKQSGQDLCSVYRFNIAWDKMFFLFKLKCTDIFFLLLIHYGYSLETSHSQWPAPMWYLPLSCFMSRGSQVAQWGCLLSHHCISISCVKSVTAVSRIMSASMFLVRGVLQGSKFFFEGTCPAGQVLSNFYLSFQKSTRPSLLEWIERNNTEWNF